MKGRIFSKNTALAKLWDIWGKKIAAAEGLDTSFLSDLLDAGKIVLLANPAHKDAQPIVVGQPARIKVNANIGTSPLCNSQSAEKEKISIAGNAGADTIMDLSIAGDLDKIRELMLQNWLLPLGTVPMYAVGQKIMDSGRDIASMSKVELFGEVERQARQGVDFMTVHCGLSKKGAELANRQRRVMGIVSRGGSMLARWMLENDVENPFFEYFDELLDICLPYNVTLSLGDGLRPGAGQDSGDAAQWEEVINLGLLVERAREKGVQAMVEGPGHVPLNQVKSQIQIIKRLTHDAPLYVLGPLCCDCAPGYDHIAGAVGASLAVEAGADFLCYLTPAEHLTLPDANDVKTGIIASKIAAQIGEAALGRSRALKREEEMSRARGELNWEGMKKFAIDPGQVENRRNEHKQEEVCAMCGKFCAVKMMEETIVRGN